jgi:hypothetical protein
MFGFDGSVHRVLSMNQRCSLITVSEFLVMKDDWDQQSYDKIDLSATILSFV